MRRALLVLGGVLLCAAASCDGFGGSTPYFDETGGAGGSDAEAGGAGGGQGGTDAGTAGQGGMAKQCGLVDQPGDGLGSVSFPSCLEVSGSRLFSVVHLVDGNCDGAAERCDRTDEVMLPTGLMVPYARYDGCSCDVSASAVLSCNKSGTFLKSRWDTDTNGVADKDCSIEAYDEKGRMTYEQIDRHCSGTPEKCFNYEYDTMGRQQAFPCESSAYDCKGYRDESEWRPAEWGTDVNCDGRLDEDCVRSSFFFPTKKIIDQDCDGMPESGCEHILFDQRGCPLSVESNVNCDGVLDGCVVVISRSDDCAQLSVGEDKDCDGVPDGYPCSYLDMRGPLEDAPMDQDCDGVMDLRCKIHGFKPALNAFWEAADDDCDGKIDAKCEVWHWTPVR